MAGRSTTLTRLCNQEATLWERRTPDGFGGFVYSAGRSVMVKWIEKQRLVTVQGGGERLSQASFVAAEVVVTGSWIALMAPDTLDSNELADPMAVAGSYEVLSLESASALSGDVTVTVCAVGRE